MTLACLKSVNRIGRTSYENQRNVGQFLTRVETKRPPEVQIRLPDTRSKNDNTQFMAAS